MLTGSYASNIYGRIRSTFDADLVITLTAAALEKLGRALAGDRGVAAANVFGRTVRRLRTSSPAAPAG